MRITTPSEVARQAGNKYLGVLVAAKFARYLNEFPKDQLAARGRSSPPRRCSRWSRAISTTSCVRRRRSEA